MAKVVKRWFYIGIIMAVLAVISLNIKEIYESDIRLLSAPIAFIIILLLACYRNERRKSEAVRYTILIDQSSVWLPITDFLLRFYNFGRGLFFAHIGIAIGLIALEYEQYTIPTSLVAVLLLIAGIRCMKAAFDSHKLF